MKLAIENDRQKIGIDRFLEIEYDNFCNDVHENISRIDRFFAKHGVQISKRASTIPNQFTEREEFGLPEQLIQKVRDYAHQV